MTGLSLAYTSRTVIARDGVRLAVRDYGSRASATHTVVLLHGLCLSQSSWDLPLGQLLRQFGRDIRFITYDHRGHGDSGAGPVRTYRFEALADDLADVLTSLRVTGPVTFAGHSMGGMTALTYLSRPADQRPVDPQGLVLVATSGGKLAEHGLGRLLKTPAARLLCTLVHRAPLGSIEQAVRTLARPLCALLAGSNRFGAAERSKLAAMVTSAVDTAPLATVAGFLPSLRGYDVTHTLGDIRADTTVLSGAADVLTPISHARELADGIPGAVHMHHKLAGHMLLHEIPDVVAGAIARAVESLSGRFQTAAFSG